MAKSSDMDMPYFPGPLTVRDEFVKEFGHEWVTSYIDPALWLNANRTIVARNGLAYDRIRERAHGLMQRLDIKLIRKPPK